MPREFGRNQRVAQFIKEELSVLIQRYFPLNEYGMVTVVSVDLSPDLKNATVYLTSLNDEKAIEKLMVDINEQAGHLRHELSSVMTSKGVPVLQFKYDKSIERAQRLTDLIDAVSTKDSNTPDD